MPLTAAAPRPAAGAGGSPGAGRRADGWLVAAGLVAVGAVLVWYAHLAISSPGMWSLPLDLSVYRDAGLIVRHVPPWYDPRLASPLFGWPGPPGFAGIQFIYPPFAALPFALMSYLPLHALTELATAADLGAVLAVAWVAFGALGYRPGARRWGLTLLVTAAALLTEPVQRTIYLGQIELVLMALVAWDMCQDDARRWKGAAVGLAAGIKLIPLIFIAYLVVTRRFRQAAVAAAAFAGTIAVGFIALPRDSSQWWLHGLFLHGSYRGNISYAGNQSVLATVSRAGGTHSEWLVTAALLLVIGLGASAVVHLAGHRALGIAGCALTALLVSPVSWDHHWVWVVFIVAVLVHYSLTAPRIARWAGAGLCASVLAVFGAWATRLWGETTDPAGWDRGIIWAPPNGSGAEAGWHGWQLATGNAYVLTGLALLAVLTGIAARLAARRSAASASADGRSDAGATAAAHARTAGNLPMIRPA